MQRAHRRYICTEIESEEESQPGQCSTVSWSFLREIPPAVQVIHSNLSRKMSQQHLEFVKIFNSMPAMPRLASFINMIIKIKPLYILNFWTQTIYLGALLNLVLERRWASAHTAPAWRIEDWPSETVRHLSVSTWWCCKDPLLTPRGKADILSLSYIV